MTQYFKPISISLSPNVQRDDLKLALNLLVRPWLWKNGKHVQQFEDEFRKYLGTEYAFSFNSGRSSLYAILQSLNLEKGSEVLLQAFTCNAVPNPILWSGFKPVYVDCNLEDFTMSIADLEAKIGSNTKALIVQHTFGLPANMHEIKRICQKHNIILIEDCAHALGAEYENKRVGTFGDAAFFSFSRDKVISSVYGGMAVTNNTNIKNGLEKLQKQFGMPSRFWIFQQILHPIFLHFIVLPLYSFLDLGKMFLVFFQVTHILSKAVSFKEKRGLRPDYFPKAMPNALAIMAHNQFAKLDIFNNKRIQIANYYFEALRGTGFGLPQTFSERKNIYLRFPITKKNAHQIIQSAWSEKNILIGDWYTTVIAPDDTKLDSMHYISGSCRNAQELSQITLNLPTHINMKKSDIDRVVNFLKDQKNNIHGGN